MRKTLLTILNPFVWLTTSDILKILAMQNIVIDRVNVLASLHHMHGKGIVKRKDIKFSWRGYAWRLA